MLQALGVARQAGTWTRLISHALRLARPDWRVPVIFRVPVAPELVWALYRSGDEAALARRDGRTAAAPAGRRAGGAPGRAGGAQRGLQACASSPACLPALQAECATPQDLPELKAACRRAQERWERRVTELDTLEGLNSELAFTGYPDTFPKARRLQRKVTLFVGPPNSGKTYTAFQKLAGALDGAYLAPLAPAGAWKAATG